MDWFRGIPYHLPVSTGPSVPGIMDVMLEYGDGGTFFRMYYPTNAKSNLKENSKKWIPWIPDESYLAGLAEVLMLYMTIMRIVFWKAVKMRIPALYGEKPKTDKKLKCVVMSHGLGGNRFLYTNVCCELASRGFLVAALEHRDNSACNTFYYASQEDAKNDIKTKIDFKHVKFGEFHYAERNAQLKKRADECSRVVDFLINLQNGNVPHNVVDDVPTNGETEFKLEDLVGYLDLDTMTMMGHSFGAATALYTLSIRHEFKQGILLDPWMFPIKNEDLHEKLKQPLIFINTQTFHIQSNVNAMSKMLTGDDRQMFTIKHTTHENQTDSVLLIGYWLNWFMKKIDPILALKLNNSLIFSFLNKFLDYPSDVQDCKKLLEERKEYVEEGLTKPWA